MKGRGERRSIEGKQGGGGGGWKVWVAVVEGERQFFVSNGASDYM